jgi:hypothetical protein
LDWRLSGKFATEGLMNDQIFQEAYARVRGRYDDLAWFSLSPRQITDCIYREMRLIDRERLSPTAAASEAPGSGALAAAAE